MKTKFLILFAIGIIGLSGVAFAAHDADQPLEHSIILPPDMKEKSFDEFMEWCMPHYEDLCAKLEKSRIPIILSPLKQFKSGTLVDNMQCNDNLVLIQKHNGSPACVTSSTATSLTQREWGISREFLVNLVENSDAIITGMVVGEESRPNGERHVWLGSYEWLKQGRYDDQQLFLEQTITHTGNGLEVPFERGEEVLLFLKNVDVKRGAYDLVDSEWIPAQKYSIKLRDIVATFFDHKFFDKSVNNYEINEDYCTEKSLTGDLYYYCTTKSESHVQIETLTEKIKEKMLENISLKYFEEHFDLKIVSDEPDAVPEPKPNSGPYMLPTKASGQNIEFVFNIDGVDFNYFMRTTFDKEQNQMYLHYHPPKEIKSIVNAEDKVNKLIYSCLDKEMYKFPYKPFHVSYHAEDGLSPVVEGHGPPTVYDRWGDAPVQDREKVFRVWLATGKVDCSNVHQEHVPENKKRPEKILLFDSIQLERLDLENEIVLNADVINYHEKSLETKFCTASMIEFLDKNSDMFDNSKPYGSPLDGDVLHGTGINPDDMVECENELYEKRSYTRTS